MSLSLVINPIGIIHSDYRERFGTPRQSGLVHSSRTVCLLPNTNVWRDAVRGLSEFSHIWVIFIFHATAHVEWQPLVRPPRLGGKNKKGVLSTRSPHRPNPIGLSAVELIKIEETTDHIVLHLGAGDFVDQTPVIDIKPYIAYCDSIRKAECAWASLVPSKVLVKFDPKLSKKLSSEMKKIIREVLSLDPRPASQSNQMNQTYGCKLRDGDVRWVVKDWGFLVIDYECT